MKTEAVKLTFLCLTSTDTFTAISYNKETKNGNPYVLLLPLDLY